MALPEEGPVGCKDILLPDPLLENHLFKRLRFELNTQKPYSVFFCLFRPLALHLHGKSTLEGDSSNLFNLFLDKTGEIDLANF